METDMDTDDQMAELHAACRTRGAATEAEQRNIKTFSPSCSEKVEVR